MNLFRITFAAGRAVRTLHLAADTIATALAEFRAAYPEGELLYVAEE